MDIYKEIRTLPREVLENELKRRQITESFEIEGYPEDYWKVWTEADAEGRSRKKLGIWYGHIIDIALHLADKRAYWLTFDRVEDSSNITPEDFNTPSKVNDKKTKVSLCDKSLPTRMGHKDRNNAIKRFLWKDNPTNTAFVSETGTSCSFTITI